MFEAFGLNFTSLAVAVWAKAMHYPRFTFLVMSLIVRPFSLGA